MTEYDTGEGKPQAPELPSGHQPGNSHVASLVLGLLSIPAALFVVGGLLAVAGLYFGIRHLKRYSMGRGLAWSGVAASGFGMVLSVLFLGLWAIVALTVAEQLSLADVSHDHLQSFVGQEAPNWTVTTLDGTALALSDLRGRRVIVDIWATWCPPCVMEVPHFKAIAESYSDVVVLGVSAEDDATVRAFAQEHGINYPIAAVPQGEFPPPFADVQFLPTTFFIDASGVFRSVAVGYHDLEDLKARVEAM